MRSIPKAPGLAKKPEAEVAPVEVKSPMYKGKNKAKAPREDKVDRPPIPVSGKGGPPSFSNAGGRFGRGGWQGKSRAAGLKFGRTPEQEAESEAKKRRMALKKKAVKTRLSATKQGPNEKQSQLLGE